MPRSIPCWWFQHLLSAMNVLDRKSAMYLYMGFGNPSKLVDFFYIRGFGCNIGCFPVGGHSLTVINAIFGLSASAMPMQ